MKITKLYNDLTESKIFRDWKKENNDDYLVNFFKFFEAGQEAPWQVGFFNKEKDLMTTFVMGEEIIINPPSEVFKKDDTIEELDVAGVREDYEKALVLAQKFQVEKHPGEKPVKIIILLQTKKGVAHYNITYITSTLKTLNMKVSALVEDVVLESKLTNLMDFKKD